MMKGTIFNIQRYTINDGPGIRTEIFMKGCPLKCWWCGNPEGLSSKIQNGFFQSKCLGVKKCNLCKGQRNNAEVCPTDAIKQWGQEISVEAVMEIIRRDKKYYESSGGGVTISGGEPLLHADFVREIFKRCRAEGIHTCIETTLYADWETVQTGIEYADMIITDIKHMDGNIHREYTGVSNDRILKNMSRIVADYGNAGTQVGRDKYMILRIPMIPWVNDDMDNIEATADFIVDELRGNIPYSCLKQLQILPFMRLGEEKYASLGMDYPMAGWKLNRKELTDKINGFVDYFNSRGIKTIVGTSESGNSEGNYE